jgi:integrase
MSKRNKDWPAYLAWRNGRPRWEPGPKLRKAGCKGRDLKDSTGAWLTLGAAVDAANAINLEVAQRAASTGGVVPRRPRFQKPQRTCRDIMNLWRATPEFSLLAASTRRDYLMKADVFLAAFGDEPVAVIGRKLLTNWWRSLYAERGHAMANGVLAVTRAILSHAVAEEWIDTNPAFNLRLKSVPPRVMFWSPAKVSALCAIADSMGRASVADAVIIALHSAQRQADVLALPPRVFADDRIAITQHKTGALVDIPMTPALAARVAAIRERWKKSGVIGRPALVIDERTGQPYTGDSFRRAFREVRAAAVAAHPELDTQERFQPPLSQCTFQDLRDTAVTRLATAPGNDLVRVAAISGHSQEHVGRVIKHYLAVTKPMADEAVANLTAWLKQQGVAL